MLSYMACQGAVQGWDVAQPQSSHFSLKVIAKQLDRLHSLGFPPPQSLQINKKVGVLCVCVEGGRGAAQTFGASLASSHSVSQKEHCSL